MKQLLYAQNFSIYRNVFLKFTELKYNWMKYEGIITTITFYKFRLSTCYFSVAII